MTVWHKRGTATEMSYSGLVVEVFAEIKGVRHIVARGYYNTGELRVESTAHPDNVTLDNPAEQVENPIEPVDMNVIRKICEEVTRIRELLEILVHEGVP